MLANILEIRRHQNLPLAFSCFGRHRSNTSHYAVNGEGLSDTLNPRLISAFTMDTPLLVIREPFIHQDENESKDPEKQCQRRLNME